MGKTFRDMVREARRQIRVISAQEAKPIIERGAAMLIDVREAWEIAQHGTIPGARNITRGELEIRADTELPRRDPALADRAQKIFLTCGAGSKSGGGSEQPLVHTGHILNCSRRRLGCIGSRPAGPNLRRFESVTLPQAFMLVVPR